MKKLFKNGHFHLLNEYNQIAQAVLVIDGIIISIYQYHCPNLMDCEVIDLNGLHIYPGFIDTHTHSFEGGLYQNGIDLYDCTRLSDIFDKISSYYNNISNKRETVLFAWRFDENKINEKRFPTPQELNKVVPDVPLLLRRIDGHSCQTNVFAQKLMAHELGDKLFNMDVHRAEANDRVVYWFHRVINEEAIINAYQTAATVALKGGHTTVHTMIGDAQQDLTHYSLIRDNLAKFPVEYILYPQSFNIKAAIREGATRIGGCILADGSIGSYTAALTTPYYDAPGQFGKLYHDDSYWHDFITTAHQHGLQVGVHCIGDSAIKQINDIYLELARNDYKDLRHELIHCEITPNNLLTEIAESKAVPVMQPAFDSYWGGKGELYQQRLGLERYQTMNRLNTMLINNIPVTGGSDWYITELNALKGICSAVNHNNLQERLSIKDAIKIYTQNAAYLSHDEHRLGQIQVGYQADFTVLTDNLLTTDDLCQVKVDSVIKKGKCVFVNEDT